MVPNAGSSKNSGCLDPICRTGTASEGLVRVRSRVVGCGWQPFFSGKILRGSEMGSEKVRVPDLARMKARKRKIAMLTAYDYCFARLFDQAGIDLLLVGDSLGMTVQGRDTTLPVTV